MFYRGLQIFVLALVPMLVAAEESRSIKNVLFIIADDLRANVLGCYGDPICQTPNIDRLARKGLVFERAYCQGLSCAPSRQSLMYSRYAGNAGVNMGEHFRVNGWYTARVGKIYHMRVPGDIIAGTNGADVASSWTERFNSPGREAHTPGDYQCLNLNVFTRSQENRQSTRMPHRPFVAVISDGDGSDQPDHKTASKAIELLRQRNDDPFFLALGFVRPHYPMVQPQKYFSAYPWQQMQLPAQQANDTEDIPKLGIAGSNNQSTGIGRYPDNQLRMWSAYYASVTFMDEQVGRVLDELDRLGLRESTAVVFTSDHGYHLGDHGFWQKSNMHEQVVRVPLIMDVPHLPAGRTDSLVELLDIYPTLSSLGGLAIPDKVQGEDLTPILRDPKITVRRAAMTASKNNYSMRFKDWHLMRYRDGTMELYDMRVDPDEFTNLANDPRYTDQKQVLVEALKERVAAAGLKL